ncbi:recC [Wigglesworthia glossinidia endosymbiont of Glossina brevipalpis]|uniref:RecBCD enzyme subunit RecC n=1 Tax=Wigglesworthia glossinidia brevipalpis TaxID=36870 RepID=Q8D2T9_WIGBR|nr:recC [Wigglesworthia glossinidia endosymbiont of Glossina brevipalpis]
MIYIYQSNQIDLIQKILSKILKNFPINNPMKKEIIITSSSNISEWLKLNITLNINILANVEFISLNSFIWKLVILTTKNVPFDNFAFRLMLSWYIAQIIPKINKNIKIKNVYKNLNQFQIFYLSYKLSELYNKYLIFKPDWIDLLNFKKKSKKLEDSQYFQLIIWNLLVKKIKKEKDFCISSIYESCIQKIEKSNLIFEDIADRIFIFGIYYIPEIYLKILKTLSKKIDIHLFCINPCCLYWFDIDNRFYISNLIENKIKNKKNFFRKKIKISLLSFWGCLGAKYLKLLNNLNENIENKIFYKPKKDNLLHTIQNDILYNKYYNIIISKKFNKFEKKNLRVLNSKDNSITIHTCKNKYEEINSLYNFIVKITKDNKKICFKDILVMASNIEDYSSYINSIFNNINYKINYFISDIKIYERFNIISAIFNILKLPKFKFSIEQIFYLLEFSSISNKFKMKEDEIKMLKYLVINLGVQWGISNKRFKKCNANFEEKYSWNNIIKKTVSEYYTRINNKVYFKYIYSNDLDEKKINSLIKLENFISKLNYWYDYLSQPHLLYEWNDVIKKIIKNFFDPDKKENYVLDLLKKNWNDIIFQGINTKYKKTIYIETLENILYKRFKKENFFKKNKFNSIHFCNLKLSKIIPSKIICLLGINDGTYPRQDINYNFDSIYKNLKNDDKNIRQEDLYSFLIILLSSKEHLYISFIKNYINEERSKYISIIINELIEYISVSFYIKNCKSYNFLENINNIKKILFKKYNNFYFFRKEKIEIFNKKYFLNNININSDKKIFSKISINEFFLFYSNPIKFWCKKKLKINFSKEHLYKDNEFILKNKFNSYRINIILFEYLIKNKYLNKKDLLKNTIKYFFDGVFEEIIIEKKYYQIIKLINNINKHLLMKKETKKVFFKLDRTIIFGWLPNLQNSGLLRWNPKNLSLQDGFLFWIEHLIYCIIGGKGDSIFLGIESYWHFKNINYKKAKHFFKKLLVGYELGIENPIFLLNKSGGAWINHSFNKEKNKLILDEKTKKNARSKLISAWQGNKFINGDSQDFYISKVIPFLTENNINKIINESKKYFIFPLKFNKLLK